MIEIKSLTKIYEAKKRYKKDTEALHDVSLTFQDNGMVFIIGKSGSGKSTFLNILGGLETPTTGSFSVDGCDVSNFSKNDFDNYRSNYLSFIFQDYYVLDKLTVYENVKLALNIQGTSSKDDSIIHEMIDAVGLSGLEEKYPNQLSGGQKQRVAVARALVKKPKLILCDEPTGNLDEHTSKLILDLLKKLSSESLVLIVSRNHTEANFYADRLIELDEGNIISDLTKTNAFLQKPTLIDDTLYIPGNRKITDEDVDIINDLKENKKIEISKNDYSPSTNESNISSKYEHKQSKYKNRDIFGLSKVFILKRKISIIVIAILFAVFISAINILQSYTAYDGKDAFKLCYEMDNSDLLIDKSYKKDVPYSISSVNCTITDDDIAYIENLGYQGNHYLLYNFTIFLGVVRFSYAGDRSTNAIFNGVNLLESSGLLNCDEDFLVKKFGKDYKNSVVGDITDTSGLIITDYLCDQINNYIHKSYSLEDFLTEYNEIKISAIIKTDYKEKYKDLFEIVNAFQSAAEMNEYLLTDPSYQTYKNDVLYRLGLMYSISSNLFEDYDFSTEKPNFYFPSAFYNDLQVNHVRVVKTTYSLQPNEIVMSTRLYNSLFGTNYSASTDSFVENKVKIAMYHDHYYKDKTFFEKEFTIKYLYGTSDIYIGLSSSDYNDYSYLKALPKFILLDNVLDNMNIINQINEPYNVNLDCQYTYERLTKFVDTFSDLFTLIEGILCGAVIGLLIYYSISTIVKSRYEIGVIKSIGCKNKDICKIFVLESTVLILITILFTLGLSTILTNVANNIITSSIESFYDFGFPITSLNIVAFKVNIISMDLLAMTVVTILSTICQIFGLTRIKPIDIIKNTDS